MSDDTSKLLNACVEYRAKLDELEDENRRLHVELDAYHNGEQLRVLRAEVNVTRQNYESFKADNIALRAAIAESEEFARKNGETLAAKVKELLDENTALRACVDRTGEANDRLVVENAALQSKLKLQEFDAVGKQTMLQRLIDDLHQAVEEWKREATEAKKRSAFVASENAALWAELDSAIVLLQRWNKNDVTDDVVIETRAAIDAARKEALP